MGGSLDRLFTMPAFGQTPFATQAHPLKHVKRTNIAKVHVTRAKHDLPVDDSEASTSGRSEQADCGRHIPGLSKKEFSGSQAKTGRVFHLDGSAQDKTTANVKRFCNANELLERDISGKHMYVSPPFSMLGPVLRHYQVCKAKDPEHTSLCVLVPAWQNTDWRPLMKGFRLLKEYRAGDKVFEERPHKGPSTLRCLRYPCQMFYDSPVPPQEVVGHGQGLTMAFVGQVAGVRANILVDSGASDNIISSKFVNQMQLTKLDASSDVVLPDGKVLLVLGDCNVRFRLGNITEITRFKIVDTQIPFDAFLGDAWLDRNMAILSWRDKSLHVWRNNVHHKISASTPGGTDTDLKSDQSSSLMSCMQVKRALRKGCSSFLVMVSADINDAGQHNASTNANVQKSSHVILQDRLHELTDAYSDVFAAKLPPGILPDRGAFVTIPTDPAAEPPFRHMYRLNPQERGEVIKQITELLQQGLIEPSTSPYGAPILFVAKKDGTLRMVIDYRALNKITVKNRYPLPRIDDLLDQLQGATHFSSLDLTSGYHQVPLHPTDVPKTAFRTPMGSFHFKVLSMGLTNAPSTFVHVMNSVFAKQIGKSVLVYLDDILVFSKTAD